MDGSGETRDGLIELARVNGYEISAAQLRRWHLAGLLPRPEQEHLSRGRGTRSIYPAGTGEQLVALCELHLGRGEKRLDRVAWRLWWRGHDVSMEQVRIFLEKVAAELDRLMEQLVDPEGGLSESAQDQVDAAAKMRLSKPLSGARKRVGAKSFDTFVGLMYGLGTGTFEALQPGDPQADIDRRVLEKGLGLERARTDRIGGNEPWLPEDWAGSGLAQMSRFIGGIRWGEELAGLAGEELRDARDSARPWLEMIGGYARIFEQTLGRGALGITAIGEAIREAEPEDQAYFVLLWAVGRAKGPAVLREGMRANGVIDPGLREGLGAWELLYHLRREIPAVAEALPPREFGAAIKDPRRMERLEGRLARLRERHADEIGAFFRAHPEHGYGVEEPGGTTPGPPESARKGGDNHG